MEVIDYLRSNTINDAALYRTVAIVVQPMNSEVTHRTIISAGGIKSSTGNSSSSSSSSRGAGTVAVDSVDASTHMTPPTSTAALLAMDPLSVGDLFLGLLRVVPRTAAAVQSLAARALPVVWRLTPPVLVPSRPLSIAEAATMKSSPRFVALHPHRRILAAATPREGASRHGAILIYDLQQQQRGGGQQQQQEPKQVLRNVLLRDMCGIAWKPGSKNVLCVYGHLGAALFHLSVDPATGLDVDEQQQQQQQDSMADDASNRARKSNAFVHSSTGAAAPNHLDSSSSNLGIGCLYPAADQLSRFGIAPPIDRVSFFPGNGRLLACGSSESAGVRIVDVAFSPMEQLYSEWNTNDNSKTATDGKSSSILAGTFCGSPAGGTCDLAWIPSSSSSSSSAATAPILLRTVHGANCIEMFAVGVAHPVATLQTEVPVVQIVMSTWPNLEASPSAAPSGQQQQQQPQGQRGGGGSPGGNNNNNTTTTTDIILRNIARNGHHGVVGHMAPLLDVKPDRHVPMWMLYDRCEGAVLSCLSFSSAKAHRSDAPAFVTNLLRVSTTAPGQAPSTHPGGRVTRIAVARESPSLGSRDSGTLLLSVESGHVVAVKLSRNSSPATGGGAGVFCGQTTMIVPADEDLASEVAAELVGVFSSGSNTAPAGAMGGGGGSLVDSYTFVTWNAQDGTARIVTATSGKTERVVEGPPR